MKIRRTKILGFTLLLTGLALCVTGLWLLLDPAQYQATAVIKVESRGEGEIGSFLNNSSVINTYDPYFLQTEFEIIQSSLVLSNVVKSLNLNAEWGEKHGNGSPLETVKTIKLLQRRMNLEPVRNTKLIKISFTSEDPNEAARIANAIAEAYQDYRQATRRQVTTRGIEVLTEQYQKEEEQIRVVQTNVDSLRLKLDSYSFSGMSRDKMVQEMQTTLDTLRRCDTNKLRDVLPIVIPNPTLNGLLDKRYHAQQQYIKFGDDYSPTNSDVLRVKAKMDELTRQIDYQISVLLPNFEKALKVKQAELEIENNYREQNPKLEQMIEFHKVLAAKIESEKLDNLRVLRDSPVLFIDTAAPPKFPVSPNRRLGAALFILGLCSNIGGFLLLKSSKQIR